MDLNKNEILIVEDSPTQAMKLGNILEEHGFEANVTTNGEEALNYMNDHLPLMVISDVVMPEMGGYQLCQKIKSDEKLKSVPVILLTTLSDPEYVFKGLEAGAHNFILKPYDEQYLISQINYIKKNLEANKTSSDSGEEIYFGDQKYAISSSKKQILNFLTSTYEIAIQKNRESEKAKKDLRDLNSRLEEMVKKRTKKLLALNKAYQDEIDQRKKAEAQMKDLLRKKEILLGEIHHRVKNNLAITSALMKLEVMDINDPQIAEILKKSEMRIKAMALIHEKLYESSDFSRVSFQDYIEDLLSSISGIYEDPDHPVRVDIDIEDVSLNINQGMPCALILNELITNAYKHAFEEVENPAIRIRLVKQKNRIHLKVSDNGVGIPEETNPLNSSSFGFKMIQTLSRQLKAEYSFENDNGTKFTIKFKQKDVKGSSGAYFPSKD